MLEIRLFEEKVQELFMEGQIAGHDAPLPGPGGRLASARSARCASDDYLTITYRGHGHALARGMTMEAAFGELMGRTSGCCHGVGGSMHLTDFSRGPDRRVRDHRRRATRSRSAPRMSARLRGTRLASRSAFCGDGATNIGTFHEALNMAAVWKAPVVFVIENNLYGEYSPLRDTTPLDDIAERAKGYGIPGVIVDGQDVDAVHEAVVAPRSRARAPARARRCSR